MRHGTRINLIVLLGLLLGAAGVILASRPLLWTTQAQEPAVLHVKPAASGDGDCSTWDDACTLQNALSGANPGDEIWVAQGTHKPGTVPTDTFQLVSGVAIYGGFAATETLRMQRDWVAHPTVLSGDLDGNDGTDPNGVVTDTANIVGVNAWTVVTGSGVTETAVLDGFTITAGNANDTSADCGYGEPCQFGGGMYNDGGSPTLVNVTFSGNTATAHGGGMSNSNSSPTLTHVTFSGNTAPGGYGGGMSNSNSSPTLTHVTFNDNTAQSGGGIFSDSSSALTLDTCTVGPGNNVSFVGGGIANGGHLTVTNSTITGNSGTGIEGGAGIHSFGGALSVEDSTISGNATNVAGGGILIYGGSVTLTHCTVTGNTADLDGDEYGGGGGIYQEGGSVHLKNTIVAGNVLGANSTASGPDLWGDFTSLGYNLIGNADDATFVPATGDQVGSGAAPLDPLLADLALNPPGRTETHALLADSPALDWIPYGVNGCGSEVPTDQRGVSRPQPAGGACDVGAYEASGYVIHLPLVLRNASAQ